jgi:hypothetical protein
MRYHYPGLIDFDLTIPENNPLKLSFEVFFQDPSITTNGWNDIKFTASDGLSIRSVGRVELVQDIVYLKGSSREEAPRASKVFESKVRCILHHDRILKAFEEFAESKGTCLQRIEPRQEQLSLWD